MGEIFMPKMGDAMTEGKVVQWYKKAGDQVEKGEPVLEIETDKVNLDLEAEESGTLSKVLVEEGEMAEVGQTLAVIGEEGAAEAGKKGEGEGKGKKKPSGESEKSAESEKSEKSDKSEKADKPQKTEKKEKVEKADKAVTSEDAGRDFVKSSPLARKIAAEEGVDLGSIRGSGPGGRVVADDVRSAAESGAPGPAKQKVADEMTPAKSLESKEVPLSAMRKTIALRLSESLGPVPHFFLTIETDVTRLLEMRAQLNEMQPVKTSVNDFVVRAVAISLLDHPWVNASFGPEAIELHGTVDVGVAVATEEGLLTPVVRNADRLSVPAIAERVRDLADRARNRKLKPDEYQGSTFTISNLGMYGIDEFTAIINPPNAAILAVGSAVKKPVVVDDEIVISSRMRMTMSCDHRVIDGAMGAEFLQTLKTNLEQPLRLLISGGGE
ncbi:MAG: dihydrolipoamide acetyltransferase family protein [Thermoanaerobaculia bacterium]|nr:dihydrolipoamide acetyltransferase family protein [Thermoanaerobaculia bacterium]